MSTARHHAEWLSLLEISGPFLSMPVLLDAFPQGLDARDPEQARELRAAYEEWADNQQGLRPQPAIHTAWVRYVLVGALELPDEVIAAGQAMPQGLKATVPEHAITLRPDLVVVDPADQKPQLLIQIYPVGQDLEKTVAGDPWQAPPGTRMMTLLHATEVRLGLVTNGEQWMLVNAPVGETTGFISWYASLWLEEKLTLRAFHSLLGVERFFNVPQDQTLTALLTASARDQQEVTDQLGYQVRRAVEILIQAIDRADQDRGRTLLAGLGEPVLYEAALTVMMRLVFLLTAEERKLLPLEDSFYSENYAIATLRAQQEELTTRYGEELLEYRYDAWSRLLATFRAVHSGLYHDRLTLPAYGGSLFDPDRFPFLEGRMPVLSKVEGMNDEGGTKNENGEETHHSSFIIHPLPISNRTVLHLLNALQLLRVKVPGGGPAEARRLSFRALDIEQIGHVYESLLDHTAVRAAEPVLGLTGTRYKEPEIPLSMLESLMESPPSSPDRGAEFSPSGGPGGKLLDFLKEQTGRSASALKKALPDPSVHHSPLTIDHSQLRSACGNDDALYRRVLPWADLIRADDFGRPVVIPAGSVYVTAGTERRATGTHYTPKALTEPIVQHTLEPLVYKGPAEGQPRDKWKLRPAADLLNLKVCDMAMGSGAFLVQTCRYLSERLVEAWSRAEAQGSKGAEGQKKSPPPPRSLAPLPRITPEGKPATGDPGEQLIPTDPDERLILAKRLVADRCLYGVDKKLLAVEMAKLSLWLVTMDKNRAFTFLDHALKGGDSLVGVDLDQLTTWNLSGEGERRFETLTIQSQIEQMISLRRQLEAIPVNSVADQSYKRQLFEQAEAVAHDLRQGGDMLIGSYFNDLKKDEQEYLRTALLLAFRDGQDVSPERAGQADLGHLRPFHWPLEFPEVFLAEGQGGFDAFVSNPPFIGGKRISTILGETYRRILYELYPKSSGNADISAFFFLRGYQNLQCNGTLGLLATNTIAQGDTHRTGLSKIVAKGGTIYWATNDHPWPGQAAVVVNVIHISKGQMQPPFVLDDQEEEYISSSLDNRKIIGEPHILEANRNRSFIGSILRGMGFVLDPEEANILINKDSRNVTVVKPYLNGQDLNGNPDQSASRWVVDFSTLSLSDARTFSEPFRIVKERVYPARMDDPKNRKTYEKMWWQFWRTRSELYSTIASLHRVLVISRVSAHHFLDFVDIDQVFADRLVVIVLPEFRDFALLSSSAHDTWAHRPGTTTHETRRTYFPQDVFETFPFPNIQSRNSRSLDAIGETYHEHRRQLMLDRQEGLTKSYNRFHNPAETAADIARLRELHVEMDVAVAVAYGWADLDLDHDFHDTPQGLRYTISEAARREVLGRLLELNHQRYEEEVLAGLHVKKKAKKKKAKKKPGSGGAGGQGRKGVVSGQQTSLPGMEDDSPQQLGLFDG